jgi:hypothetical protein
MAVGRAALPRQTPADFDFAYACEGRRRILVHGCKGQVVKRADQNGGAILLRRRFRLSACRCYRSRDARGLDLSRC